MYNHKNKYKVSSYLRLTSCGCSKFFPQHTRSHAAKDVNVKNCSPGLVGIAKKCLITDNKGMVKIYFSNVF